MRPHTYSQEELVGNVKAGTALAAVIVVWWTLRGGNKAISRITALGFRVTDFRLFRELLQRNTWDTDLETKRIQVSWLIFRYPLEAPEQSISMSRRSSKGSRRPS